MTVVDTFAEVRSSTEGRVALVPTMGFLHEGHLSLVRAARSAGDAVVVSVFVNPLQFDDPSDLDRYPRDLDRDTELAVGAGADLVFAPSVEEVYPDEGLTRVSVERVTDRMEGPNRPGHFEGVATVVAKLFAGVQPDLAVFGRKDAQQLAVVTTMARDLRFPVEIVPGSTVREEDGLALSSRNVFLSPDERSRALALARGLMAAADAVEAGERSGSRLESIAADHLADVDHVEYVELASQRDASRLVELDRPAFLAVAARVGSTRLIDNVAFDQADESFVPDRGERLDRPSIIGAR